MSLDCVAGVGGIMVIELLAGTMRRGRWMIERMRGNARRRNAV